MFENGNTLVIDQKELDDKMKELPENPYQPALWVNEHGEVVLAVYGNALKFKKREDAQRIFKAVEELFDALSDGEANGRTAACGQIF